jgi:hypothetical protein
MGVRRGKTANAAARRARVARLNMPTFWQCMSLRWLARLHERLSIIWYLYILAPISCVHGCASVVCPYHPAVMLLITLPLPSL